MSAAPPISPRRYRRRILGLGAVVFVLAFAVGAAIFIPIVQNDLEDRVEQELRDNGIEGVTASFSGQDGTLVCAEPLADPGRAQRLSEDVWGVRVIDLDITCDIDDTPIPDDTPADDNADPDATDVPPADTSGTTTTTEVPPDTEPEIDSIDQVVSGDPLFSQLAGLIDVAELGGDDGLGGDGPLTLFAPTDAAFDAAFDEMGADAFGELTSDPVRLRILLLHHAAEGRLAADDLQTGPLEMLDGTPIEVDAAALTFTSGDSVAGVEDPDTQLDIEASNGVVHAIDRLLVPPGFTVGPVVEEPTTSAMWTDGLMTLRGVVADDAQHAQLVAAAETGIDPANVIDELVVDANGAPTATDVDRLAVVVESMPTNLVSGDATLRTGSLNLTGVARSADTRAALEQLGATADVTVELTDRPAADVESAQQLEDDLNSFVGLNPILFEPNSTELTAEANAVIEQIAARAIRLDGVDITIVGHTDTDGSTENNLILSEGRAASVLDALVLAGVPEDIVASEGRGESEPVLDGDGVEDKAASRRVEFVVEVRTE